MVSLFGVMVREVRAVMVVWVVRVVRVVSVVREKVGYGGQIARAAKYLKFHFCCI